MNKSLALPASAAAGVFAVTFALLIGLSWRTFFA
jgi:hypothetical protein